jgi:hypothetical protein
MNGAKMTLEKILAEAQAEAQAEASADKKEEFERFFPTLSRLFDETK